MSLIAHELYGISAALHTLAAIAHIFYMFRREFDFLARWSTRVAWAVHTAALGLMVYEIGHAPVRTLFEFAFFFTWVMVTNYIVIEAVRADQSAGSFLMPVIAVVSVVAVTLPKPGTEKMIETFPLGLIIWHVGVSLLGYAFFLGSFVAAALYLIQDRNLRRKRFGPLYHRLPSLEVLDTWSARFVSIGFPLMTLGMAAGLYFAHVTWETFWQSDPKVIFTFFIWLIYGGYLLVRHLVGFGGRKAAWWSVAGVTGLLINYFVVNLLSRLHRFGV